jgi:alkylhydroperoxidase family enzyme
MYEFERLSNSLLGRLLGPLIARKIRPRGWSGEQPINEYRGPFSNVIKALNGIPAAAIFQKGLEGAFSSRVLSTELKVLMFAVVARSLGCEFCHGATYSMAMDMGFTEHEFEDALSTLTSPRLNKQEQMILTWTRETIHYQTGPMQKRMRELAQDIDDDEILLEAIGVAALANSMVRLAVLLE